VSISGKVEVLPNALPQVPPPCAMSDTTSRRTGVEWVSAPPTTSWLNEATNYNAMVRHGITLSAGAVFYDDVGRRGST
jgi:hypothetical protein